MARPPKSYGVWPPIARGPLVGEHSLAAEQGLTRRMRRDIKSTPHRNESEEIDAERKLLYTGPDWATHAENWHRRLVLLSLPVLPVYQVRLQGYLLGNQWDHFESQVSLGSQWPVGNQVKMRHLLDCTTNDEVRACDGQIDPDAIGGNHLSTRALQTVKRHIGWSIDRGEQFEDLCPCCVAAYTAL